MKLAGEVLPWFLWAGLWAAGGWLIVASLIPRRSEQCMVGISLGLIIQLWVSNLYAQVFPVAAAFWAASLTTLLLGVLFACRRTKPTWPPRGFVPVGQLLTLVLLAYVFTAVGRGLSLFDDYQNLPTVSLMAAGDIPPHFALDPRWAFGYHHLLLLFAAQTMLLADVFPWTALDVVRGVVFGLSIMLVYLWVRRMTRSRLAGYLGGVFVALSSGARWFMLLLPRPVVEAVSRHIELIGTGSATAERYSEALLRVWEIDGEGPIGFPFAYGNGINQPAVMAHGGVGAMHLLLVLLVLLLYRHWNDWRGWTTAAILIAASALVNEIFLLSLLPNLVVALISYLLLRKTWRLPRSLLPWFAATGAALLLAAVQGGVLTVLLRDFLSSLQGGERHGYHTFALVLSWPPSVVSAHLGILSLTHPAQLLAAILEIGPVLLALPLVLIWGAKMLRFQRWWEAALAVGVVTTLFVLVVQYRGTAGVSANARLLGGLTMPATLYAVPLAWVWAKKRSESVRMGLVTLGSVAVFSGVVYLGVNLVAIQKPVLSLFLHELDARMARAHWDQLRPGAMVFDPFPTRAVTIFGRPTLSHKTWYETLPEWDRLRMHPDAYALRAAGYDYAYFGITYWETLTPDVQQALQGSCVRLVDEVRGVRSPIDLREDFRRLLDVSACR